MAESNGRLRGIGLGELSQVIHGKEVWEIFCSVLFILNDKLQLSLTVMSHSTSQLAVAVTSQSGFHKT